VRESERQVLLNRWYRPHHAALREAVANELTATGRCLILDAHSFPASPLPYEVDQDASRPNICIGTDPFHTPLALVDTATAVSRDLGWTTAIDRPFSGALVPMSFYRCDARVQSLMIEVNRSLYMDETTGARSAGFESCQARIGRLISAIVSKHGA
jgi:N-formylglutamate amidohydrolase